MLHPLFTTVIQRPDLVMEHVSAYAALLQQEAKDAGRELLVKMLAWVVAGISALIFLAFAGIAVMLGSVHDEFRWVLVIIPGIPLALAIAAVVIAMKPLKSKHFPELKAQLHSDVRALRVSA